MTPRMLAALAALWMAWRAMSARVTVLPGLSVPALVPFGAVVLVLLAAAVWLLWRHGRRFRSCPHPHTVRAMS